MSKRATTGGMLPSKTGWLYKLADKPSAGLFSSFGVSNERRRFFVLRFGQLFYYRSEADFQRDAEPAEAALYNVGECVASAEQDLGPGAFQVRPITKRGGRAALKLRADSDEDMRGWLDAFAASGSRPNLG